jgi:chromosome partitioning protein
MIIVAIANQKGGVGKTTTAINIATAMAATGWKTLLVDLDPQGNASTGLGVPSAARARTTYDLLIEGATVDECTLPTAIPKLDIVPSTVDLSGAELELVAEEDRATRLRRALGGHRGHAICFIDCPPSLGLLTINALAASDAVIIPVQCEYMALEGLSRLMDTLDLVKRNLNPRLDVMGVILTMFDARTRLAAQVVEEVRGHFPQTFGTIIPRSVRLSEAPSHGKSIFLYDQGGRSATAYDAVASELLERAGVAA